VSRGIEKSERVRMEPEARREVEMLKVWMSAIMGDMAINFSNWLIRSRWKMY